MRALLVGMLVVTGCEVPEEAAKQGGVGGAGGDCRLIARSIASLELGNYAEPEVREPREREIEGMCVRARLSKADADCLLAAPSIDELGYCAKPLVTKKVVLPPVAPGDICEQYVRRLETIARCAALPPDSAKALRGQIPTLRQMYAQHGAQKQVQDNCKMALDMTDKAYKPLGC